MRTIKLHHPTGHPYWQADEYRIQMPDGKFYDKSEHHPSHGSCHRIRAEREGIYYIQCGASSGSGKTDGKKMLIIPRSQYDEIVYVGKPLVMSNCLLGDLANNGLS